MNAPHTPDRLAGRRVLIVISGGVAAFKALELIRLLVKRGCSVRTVLTRAGAEFVTPLSIAALSAGEVHTELFSLTEESRMGHIELSRAADLLVVCPASADILSAMATGRAHDLATTLLLATDKPVLVAPAMNVRMWLHPATTANVATLIERGVMMVGPDEGVMACNEYGPGRLAEPEAILAAIEQALEPTPAPAPLRGRRALVTAGPTHEPIDPVRYLANRSSGRQGYAIAAALARLGAQVTLISGPTALAAPAGVERVSVETGRQMRDAVFAALPAEIAVMTAAVADWRIADPATDKIKKRPGGTPPELRLLPNPDILAELSAPGPDRPRLVIGFAAETSKVGENARDKLARKGCDWLVANDVSGDVMGGADNAIELLTPQGSEHWSRRSKEAIATMLAGRIATALGPRTPGPQK
ncbi:phosphopantothenoylcysteine decarboxylase/phosphopantothenate--cysteine ligase [Endobacter medicaginis]|uniref:Coenzyme A biosynthesis bifunctional protein CoaBC n=3 Tax=Endobacter medicaginis TaxID=1181271 RepID=A0A839V2X9_9PROT|nr:phosphopantothenoylcysteine decarboxylase/phosphopantothenate--cysteine ligase [Endobacter medicaginis]MCX5475614.1 bifunctional phosphopantothenoylcysteine decarboxylase/phosphopantothenate--cysteine ligase CoaBC [Endobacter medicaginis]